MSTGFIDFRKQFEEIMSVDEPEDEVHKLLEIEYERQNEDLRFI